MIWHSLTDYIIFAYNSIKSRLLRSILTTLGIFVGIAAVVALISISQGLQGAIQEEFKKVGSNRIIIEPGGAQFGPPGSASALTTATLSDDDVEEVKDVLGVDFAVGIYSETAKIGFKDEVEYTRVYGTPTDAETRRVLGEIGFFDIESGRQLESRDIYKATVGNTVATEFFEKDIRVGDRIKINDVEFGVVGVQKKIGTGVHDVILRIPLDTARDLFNAGDEVTAITVTTDINSDTEEIAERIKKRLRRFRDVDGGEEDFSVQTATQRIGQITQFLGIVQLVLVGIAAISLLVGGVGIMTTMITAVLQRTKEIGVMKAIGAKNSSILALFLIESGILGTVGGLVGIILGLAISKLVEIIATAYGIPFFKAYMGFPLIFGMLLFSFFVGVVSGLVPARQAAMMKPVDALRK